MSIPMQYYFLCFKLQILKKSLNTVEFINNLLPRNKKEYYKQYLKTKILFGFLFINNKLYTNLIIILLKMHTVIVFLVH